MNTFDITVRILLGIALFLCGIKDIKTKKISMNIVIPCFVLLLICLPFRQDLSVLNSILGILVGFCMMAISKISRGQIGTGDGIILSLTGLGLGIQENVILLMYALLCASIFSVILLLAKRISKKATIPFVPFLFMGYAGVLFLK